MIPEYFFMNPCGELDSNFSLYRHETTRSVNEDNSGDRYLLLKIKI